MALVVLFEHCEHPRAMSAPEETDRSEMVIDQGARVVALDGSAEHLAVRGERGNIDIYHLSWEHLLEELH